MKTTSTTTKPAEGTQSAITISTRPQGFNYGGNHIFFVEAKGKDVSFNRWRMCLYYAPCLALTEFFETQEGYDAFLDEAAKHTFPSYAEYRAHADANWESPWIEGASPVTL